MSFLLPIRIHPEGWRFIGIFGILTFLLFLIAQPLGWLGVILTGWCAYFFRNPQRITPTRPGLIVSPADGIVCAIKEMAPGEEFGMGTAPRVRISIFLNVFDVHVNRIPMGGKIIKSIYRPGKFLNAALIEASDCNECQSLVLELPDQTKIAVIQIAGLIARRIVCTAKEGDTPQTGELFGLIRFGSRVDIYLPEGISPLVIEGQKMIGGETILADLTSQESSREGIYH
jgi:phosphatidylserine decarboxylase